MDTECNVVAESLSRLSGEQLATLASAGALNDERRLPELAAVSKYLRYAAKWELERRAGAATELTPPNAMIEPGAVRKGIDAMKACGLVAMAHDLEMAKGMDAARFYLAVAGNLMTQRTLQ